MIDTRALWLLILAISQIPAVTYGQKSNLAPTFVASTSSVPTVDVYLLGGQSNMQGSGKIDELPATIPREIPHTFFWNKSEFEPLILLKTKVSSRPSGFGPEVGFGLKTASAARPIYLVKYYASGMPLHHGWDGNTWVGDNMSPRRRNFYPGENPQDINSGTLYLAMLSEFRNAIAYLKNTGKTPQIRGLVWMQGEQDSKHQISALGYAHSLKRLRQRLAEDLALNTDLPLVFGQVLPHAPPLERFTHRNEIRSQMAACDFQSGEPESMTNTRMVSTDGLSLLPDTVHYDTQGQLALGMAFARAMRRLTAENLRVMTFNILQGGEEAANVGFANSMFEGSRHDELADIIRIADADIVGVQEDCTSNQLLLALGHGWQRVGSIYSRLPINEISVAPYLTVAEVKLANDRRVTLVNCHWSPPKNGYGPDLAQSELKENPALIQLDDVASRIIERCAIRSGPRGYAATISPLRIALEHKHSVILMGDFNEPSHLDWTERYAKEGADRWVSNPTDTPLRFPVTWPGSKQLADLGMSDSYRTVHPNEVEHMGVTWTPPYPDNTAGRRKYGDQVLDRIDRIYHAGNDLRPIVAEVVGEDPSTSDITFSRRWPSDHRAVVVGFTVH